MKATSSVGIAVQKPYVARTYATYSESVLAYLQLSGKGALARTTAEDRDHCAFLHLPHRKQPFACFTQLKTVDDFMQRLYCRLVQLTFAKQVNSDPSLALSHSNWRVRESLKYLAREEQLWCILDVVSDLVIEHTSTLFDKTGYDVREAMTEDFAKQAKLQRNGNWFSIAENTNTGVKTSLLLYHPLLMQRPLCGGGYSQDIAIIDTAAFLQAAVDKGIVALLD